MGVGGFHAFLKSKRLVKPIPRNFAVGAVCVDVADLLHVNIRRSNTPAQLTKHVVRAVKQVLARIRLRRSNGQPGDLCVFMDGVAPLSKLSLQIKRRRTQAARGKSENKKKRSLSSLALSPGTPLTMSLERGIRAAFPRAHVSGCGEPGEGEVKAIRWLLAHSNRFRSDRKLLLGGDSDLVLLAAAARPLTKITCAKMERGSFTGVSVDAFQRLAPNFTREGWTVACMMRGNDYLPALKGTTLRHCLKASDACRRRGGVVDVPTGNLRPQGLLALLEGVPDGGARGRCQKCDPKSYFEALAWNLLMYRTGTSSSRGPARAQSTAART